MSDQKSITIHANNETFVVPIGSSPPFDVDALMATWWDDDEIGIERRMAKRPLPCASSYRERGSAVTKKFRAMRSQD